MFRFAILVALLLAASALAQDGTGGADDTPKPEADAPKAPTPEAGAGLDQPSTLSPETAPADAAAEPPRLYNGMTVDEVAGLMQEAGYRAKVLTDSNGLTYIESGASGLTFEVNFYGCEGEPQRCLQLQFRASFATTPEQQERALQYNIDKVFGRAYNLDTSTYLEHAMHINGGVPAAYFTNNLLLWDNVLGEFAEYIGW